MYASFQEVQTKSLLCLALLRILKKHRASKTALLHHFAREKVWFGRDIFWLSQWNSKETSESVRLLRTLSRAKTLQEEEKRLKPSLYMSEGVCALKSSCLRPPSAGPWRWNQSKFRVARTGISVQTLQRPKWTLSWKCKQQWSSFRGRSRRWKLQELIFRMLKWSVSCPECRGALLRAWNAAVEVSCWAWFDCWF